MTDEAMARAGRDLLSYVVDSSDDAILTNDDEGTITSWNRGAERLYGYSVDEAVGESIALIEPPNGEGQQLEIVHRAFGGESIDRIETTHVRKDGNPVTVSMTVSPVREASSRIVSAAIVARDITELKRDQERLRHLADRDQLTGLYNRLVRPGAQTRARPGGALAVAQRAAQRRHRQLQDDQRLGRACCW